MKRLFLFGALFACACSLVVDPGEERCSADEGCPSGMTCIDGSCQVEACGPEVCNGRDDDCDGITDEDLGENPEGCNRLDDDCDGEIDEGFDDILEVCNNRDDDCDTSVDEDVPVMLDVCNDVDDDCDGEVDEGTMEVCNNLDDDCDDLVDEDPGNTFCTSTTVCRGECVTPTCENNVALECDGGFFCNTSVEPPRCDTLPPQSCQNDAQCEAGQLCFVDAGVCFDATPLGRPCESDVTCADGTFCAQLEAVGMTGKTCTNTCCTDTDCPSGAVCGNGFLGTRLCVPAGQAGAELSGFCEAHADCASGYCRLFREECQAVCSTDENCESSEACVFDLTIPGQEFTTGCFPAGAREPAGADCDGGLDCQSLLCSGGGKCIAPCGAAGECPTNQGCTSVISNEGQFVNVCLRENPNGRAGTACTLNGECDSFRCFEEVCVAPCCSSGQCGSGQACRPIHVGDQWPTFCIPGQ